jgi:hypothetical protein
MLSYLTTNGKSIPVGALGRLGGIDSHIMASLPSDQNQLAIESMTERDSSAILRKEVARLVALLEAHDIEWRAPAAQASPVGSEAAGMAQ